MFLGIYYSTWAAQIFTGLVYGMIFILLAMGLSLIFGMLTVVNFAHGAFYMVGAYMGLVAVMSVGSFWGGLILAPLVTGAFGMLCERTVVRRLYGLDINYPLLLTFGLSFVMIEGIRIIFGTTGFSFDTPELLAFSVNLGFMYFPAYRIFVIVVTLGLIVGLVLFLEKTNLGMIIRAGTRDATMVRVLGIDISKIWLLVFGMGTGLAGMAGVLAAPMLGVHPDMGVEPLVECFVVTVVGGMGSLRGAVLAGLLIGQVYIMTSLLYPKGSQVMIFVAMAVVLLLRPSGLLGEAGLLE